MLARRPAETAGRSGRGGGQQQVTPFHRRIGLRVLTEPFSVENGLMTPTMKPRRTLIYRSYAEELEGLYAR